MAGHRELEAYRVLLLIIGALIDDPEAVVVELRPGEDATTFHITADPRGASLLIGNRGRMARSIRTVMVGLGMQARWRYHLEVEGDSSDPDGPVD